MAVQEHDPPEPNGRERDAQVLDECHERGNPYVHDARETHVWIGQGVVDRGRHDGADHGRDAAGDLLRDEDVGQKRTVRTVLLR